jgi:hypothetical protein
MGFSSESGNHFCRNKNDGDGNRFRTRSGYADSKGKFLSCFNYLKLLNKISDCFVNSVRALTQ